MKMMYDKLYLRYLITGILIVTFHVIQAQLPVVENVRFNQRIDGSLLVDIYYDVTTAGGLPLKIDVEASDDNGATWDLPCTSLTGDVGEYIYEGTDKHAVWDFYGDNPNTSGSDFKVRVIAECMVCGQIITEDYTLTMDLFCVPDTDYMIKIGAPYITLDMGGHTMKGDVLNGILTGVLVENQDSATIRNGIVDGFKWGISVNTSVNSVIENMVVKNLEFNDPNEFAMGIITGEDMNLIVRDCQFEFLPVLHKESVVMGNNTKFIIDHIEVVNGSVGVNFGGDAIPSNGSVINSSFIDCNTAGILFHNSSDALIQDNYFYNCGIGADSYYQGRVKGVTINRNEIRDVYIGIHAMGLIESTISNNIVESNGNWGIALDRNMSCNDSDPEPYCFCSTGNTVINNRVRGNYFDLYHHEECTGNTWINNDCETSEGSEIPPCTPITATAGEPFSSVESAASELADDVGLIRIISDNCDSTGRSYKWYYIYESIIQQEKYEIWYKNGELIVQDSVTIPWRVPEPDPYPQITGLWIDSDSAVALANDQGGREFIEQTEFRKIDAKLFQDDVGWKFWEITYLAKDSMMGINIDASLIE